MGGKLNSKLFSRELSLWGRPTWAEINLDNLTHNIRQVKKLLKPGVKLMAVVKADGYGHGAVEVARRAVDEGCQWLGVALPEEGIELRRQGLKVPILVLGPVSLSSAPLYLRHNLTPTIFCWEMAQAFSEEAMKNNTVFKIHVKVDTGMGRLGFPFFSDPASAIERIAALPGLKITGLYTHFSSADEPGSSFTLKQWQRFQNILDSCQKKGITIETPHAANSGGIIKYPQSHAALVRLGISLYGYLPAPEFQAREVQLKPVLSLKSKIAFTKIVPSEFPVSYGRTYYTKEDNALLATVPIGYADGLNRRLSNSGFALVRGKKVPIAGRISMDQTVLDLSAVQEAHPGDEVVFYGAQGEEVISADEVARQLGTISYEILCAVGKRVPRVYLKDGALFKVVSLL